MDDFTYEASAIPEPSSVLLVATGLLGSVVIVRRRRQIGRVQPRTTEAATERQRLPLADTQPTGHAPENTREHNPTTIH